MGGIKGVAFYARGTRIMYYNIADTPSHKVMVHFAKGAYDRETVRSPVLKLTSFNIDTYINEE